MERQGIESKKRRRAYEKDDDEFQIDQAPAVRRKIARKPKEKKPFEPGSPNGSAIPLSITNTTTAIPPIPMIPMQNHIEVVEAEDMRECRELLTKLMEIPSADPFLEPVDFAALELWHYPTMVLNPMDLGTIKKMLQHNTLENPGHFADHVRLVFKNAMDFNQPGSGIYNDAESLLGTFEEEFKKLCEKWATEPGPELKEEEKKEVDSEEKDKKEIEILQQTLNTIKTTTAGFYIKRYCLLILLCS